MKITNIHFDRGYEWNVPELPRCRVREFLEIHKKKLNSPPSPDTEYCITSEFVVKPDLWLFISTRRDGDTFLELPDRDMYEYFRWLEDSRRKSPAERDAELRACLVDVFGLTNR